MPSIQRLVLYYLWLLLYYKVLYIYIDYLNEKMRYLGMGTRLGSVDRVYVGGGGREVYIVRWLGSGYTNRIVG